MVQLADIHVPFWDFSMTPGYLGLSRDYLVCAECGLAWTLVLDPNKVLTNISQFGSTELKERILGAGSALPRPAGQPARSEDELPRPSEAPPVD